MKIRGILQVIEDYYCSNGIPARKYCPRCNVNKDCREFSISRRRTDGLDYYCKECYNSWKREKYATDAVYRKCENIRTKRWAINNPEKTRKIQHDYYMLEGKKEQRSIYLKEWRRRRKLRTE